jgi:BirA family biotin operon repressor/biotin-[acetyl-CoA-carboxylase] ligase
MNTLTYGVLRSLASGEFCSGEVLAAAFSASRSRVWQAVRELESAGLEIYKVRGRGYRLPEPLSLLDPAVLTNLLAARARALVVEVVPSAESTNTALSARAEAGASSGTVIAAEWQTAGRGRRGRPWHSPIGGALTFSMLWRFAAGAAALGGLSLAVGLALARALERLDIQGIALKWPNDLEWNRRKVAGILIEMRGDALGPSLAIIGVGLNVRLSHAVRDAIDQPVADLESAVGRILDRNVLLAALLAGLHDALAEFERDGFAPLRTEWDRRHAYQGQRVRVALPDGRFEHGVVRGVNEDGALRLATADGLRNYHTGEVSLRRASRPRAAEAAGEQA